MIKSLLLAATLLPAAALAQPWCYQVTESSPLIGANGAVSGMFTWDPDGPGPAPQRLVLTGNFSAIGSVSAAGLATYDGSAWASLTTNLIAPWTNPNIAATGLYNNQIIATPSLSAVSSFKTVSAYDLLTDQWTPLGGAIDGSTGHASAVMQYGTDLIIGGSFTGIAGVAGTKSLAAWDGSSWRSIATLPAGSASVNAAEVFNGKLVIGGAFTDVSSVAGTANVAAWDGSAWAPFAAGLPGRVDSLVVFNGELVASGAFTGGPSYVARWDGAAWQQMGALTATAQHLTVHNAQLYCCTVTSINAIVRRWNGASWDALPTVHSADNLPLASFQNKLYAGGRATDIPSTGLRVRFLTSWDGSAWSVIPGGTNGAVSRFATWNGDVYAGGDFTTFNGLPMNRIARRASDGSWEPLGAGLDGPVYALAVHDNTLVVGGAFTTAGGSPAAGVARWTGSAWQPLGAGVNGTVYALLVDTDGTLVAGGSFTTAGGSPAASIARWNSAGSVWSTLGGGFDRKVYDLALYQGSVVATGDFDVASPVWARSIARFNGSYWNTIGPESAGHAGLIRTGPYTGVGKRLLVDGTNLYVTGTFDFAGLTASPNTAMFNGSVWVNRGTITNFTLENGRALAMGPRRRPICVWEGSIAELSPAGAWVKKTSNAHSAGEPVQDTRDLLSFNGAVFIGGVMDTFGMDPASGWASVVWEEPVIISAYWPGQLTPGATLTFHAAATGVDTLTYLWRRDGQDLSNAGRVSGVTTDTLTITGAQASDAGVYEVVITSGCGLSTTKTFTLTSPCAPDLGRQGGIAGPDGLLDNNDFVVFINDFFSNDPHADLGIQGGTPGSDGHWDNNDFIVFINLFFAGC